MEETTLEPRIIKVKELFQKTSLKIPEYQRPYKWTTNNVNQLLDDIIHHKEKSAYRLGTIVFYRDEEKEELHIVDGQQRTITLLLIALAIINDKEDLTSDLGVSKIKKRTTDLFKKLRFSNSISKKNIRENYRLISRRLVDFNSEIVQFFYNKCELVQVELTDISEAFQFFDSQNSRGKDLDPHDLLKAFHLREMADTTTETERFETVNNWQNQNVKDLKIIFSKYLYRIRNWSRGYPARKFTKREVAIFKGVSPTINEPYPFAHLSRIGHFYIDGYNKEFHRSIDKNKMDFPFQIDQIIINGKRFFEMVEHYMSIHMRLSYWTNLEKKPIFQKRARRRVRGKESILREDVSIDDFGTLSIPSLEVVVQAQAQAQKLPQKQKISPVDFHSKKSKKIYYALSNYKARKRTGDEYVRNLFDCCILYYWDKFGTTDIEKAIEVYFIWAYSLRLRLQSVQQASIDKYALEHPFTFKKLREAIQPSDALNIKIPVIDSSKLAIVGGNKDKLREIKELFAELKYHGQ